MTNFELGYIFSVYGVIALISYLFGGPLADYFSVRNLMSSALIMTSLGGLILATIPTKSTLMLLYGFWGFTTIFLFWAALIRATRVVGGVGKQGSAFGFLDGGRGLMSALLGSTLVFLFASFLTEEVSSAAFEDRKNAFQRVIYLTAGFVFFMGIMVWFVMKNKIEVEKDNKPFIAFDQLRGLMSRPAIWLQALIILCAYSAYKCTDDFSLFAFDVMGFDEVEAAKTGTISLWIRPLAAISLGLLADKFSPSKMSTISFLLLIVGSLSMASGILNPSLISGFFFILVVTSIGIYALRGLYFAIMEEGNIPLLLTGSAVGLVSVLGYTPDIFMGPLMGYLLDSSPGITGHQHVFIMVAIFGAMGLIATLAYRKSTAPSNASHQIQGRDD